MQTHVQFAEAALNKGAESLGYRLSLADFAIPIEEVLALGDEWVFDDEDSYCPISDFPDDISGNLHCGVTHSADGHAYIIGDNGNSAFMFRLSRKQAN